MNQIPNRALLTLNTFGTIPIRLETGGSLWKMK